MTEDMSQYIDVFLDEANEQLAVLERAILELEQTSTSDLLQEIFRSAHTLKGSSRAMGFANMGELTHAMEDVFDRLRKSETEVTPVIVDSLLEGLDVLKALVAEVSACGNTDTPTETVTARLRAALTGPPDVGTDRGGPAASGFAHAALSETAAVAAREGRAAGCSIYRMTVRLAADCVMRSVRALMALQSLEQAGSILATTPDEEGIESERFSDEFGLVIASTQAADELTAIVTGIAEIVSADVICIDRDVENGTYGARPAESGALPESVADLAGTPLSLEELPTAPPGRDMPKQDARVDRAASGHNQTVRVDVVRLDNLLNLVGELVIDQTRIAQLAGRVAATGVSDATVSHLSDAAGHFGRITGEIQQEIMKARMLPIDHVFSRFPRMMRDLAQNLGKQIDFVITGRETELDRSVIEVIGDPLIHLLRNSVDHGIESPQERVAAGKPPQGTIGLSARHAENYIVIEIDDDGRGIDPQKMRAAALTKGQITEEAAGRLTDREAVNLIFSSGFSTAAVVTDVSGRGVGMDIVKNNLTRFGALLDIRSTVGKGTRFTIKLPLTLAIIRGLLVGVEVGVYALPLTAVVETMKLDGVGIHVVSGREVVLHRGSTLPLVRLQDIYRCRIRPLGSRSPAGSSGQFVVVLGVGERRFGLVVDELLGEQEVVIKSLGKFIGDVCGVSGATILGDGRIALIADVDGLLTIAVENREKADAA